MVDIYPIQNPVTPWHDRSWRNLDGYLRSYVGSRFDCNASASGLAIAITDTALVLNTEVRSTGQAWEGLESGGVKCRGDGWVEAHGEVHLTSTVATDTSITVGIKVNAQADEFSSYAFFTDTGEQKTVTISGAFEVETDDIITLSAIADAVGVETLAGSRLSLTFKRR